VVKRGTLRIPAFRGSEGRVRTAGCRLQPVRTRARSVNAGGLFRCKRWIDGPRVLNA